MTLKQLGYVLQEVRNRQGLSQSELGRQAGFAQSAISSLESNPKSAKLERVFQLLSALNLEIVIRERVERSSERDW